MEFLPVMFIVWVAFMWFVLDGGIWRLVARFRRRKAASRWCRCHHEEWRHVWNSVPLPDGREPFSTAACSVEECGCLDWKEE